MNIKFERIPFELLIRAGKILFPKYRFKWHELDWWENQEFNLYLKQHNNYKKMNDDRLWMLSQLLRLCRHINGDTAECGVYQGASSYLICRDNQFSSHNKTHHIFDSFEGLSDPDQNDGVFWRKGALSCDISTVKSNLTEFKSVTYHKGWIPSKFPEVASKKFSFVHIDVDLYAPTKDSLEFFYPRMLPGGIILCDDYGIGTCPGATKAVDEFFEDKKESMIPMCSGGGFMIFETNTGNKIY